MNESQAGRMPRAALLPASTVTVSLLPAGCDPWIPRRLYHPATPVPAVTHLGSAGLPWVSVSQALGVTYRLSTESWMAVPDTHPSPRHHLASWPPGRQPYSIPYWRADLHSHIGAWSPQDARGPSSVWEFLVTPWRRMAMGSLLEGDIAYGTYPTPLAGTVRKMLLSPLTQPLQ